MIWVLLLFIAVEMGWQNFRCLSAHHSMNIDNAHHPILHKLTTGIVIAWLASSCTAPLIGTIVGVAIAGGTAQLFLMMGLLALGMASPYLLIALRPQLIKRLPTKIGKWSARIKYGVSIALLLTCLLVILAVIVPLPHFACRAFHHGLRAIADGILSEISRYHRHLTPATFQYRHRHADSDYPDSATRRNSPSMSTPPSTKRKVSHPNGFNQN